MIGRPFSPALLGSAGKVSFFVALLLAQLMALVKPEIVDLGVNMLLDANSDEVHFVKGYLKAPGSIDLSNVRWITAEEVWYELEDEDIDLELALDDKFMDDEYTEEYIETGTEATGTSEPTGSGTEETSTSAPTEILENDDDNNDTPAEEEEEPTEDADSESTPEASEPTGEEEEEEPTGDAANESIPEPSEPAAEEETEGESPVETAPEPGNDNNKDVEDPVEEATETVDEDQNQQEPEPETIETVVEDEVAEEVKVQGEDTEVQNEQPEEESATATPSEEGTDEVVTVEDEAEDTEDNSESTPVPTAADNGGDRSLATVTDQIMEIIVFLAPSDCKRDVDGNCDWVALGVGAYDDEMVGEMSYCCSQDAVDRNICSSDDLGTVIIDHTIFEGDHRKFAVPSEPFTNVEMNDPYFQVDESGDYVMVIANCNDDGLGIITLGTMEWKSKGGYLPGDQYDFMLFQIACTSIYLVLAIWYYCGMRSYQDAAIPIQKFILGTIVLGLLMHALKSVDFVYWNQIGIRSEVLMYVAIGFLILFQASLRCLGVMVAMGWGVVRDSLGMAYCKIVFMGLLYAGVALLHETFDAISMSSSGLVSSNTADELLDLSLILMPVISVINVIFYIWIIRSLKITTEYLKNMNQTSKLRRHLRLKCLVITSLLIIATLTMVNLAERIALLNVILYPENIVIAPFLTTDLVWILRAVGLGNYLFIVIGITFLWRPSADAKDYAMAMQIPTNADDDNDLELSCVVPSADDIDDGEGYKIEHAIST